LKGQVLVAPEENPTMERGHPARFVVFVAGGTPALHRLAAPSSSRHRYPPLRNQVEFSWFSELLAAEQTPTQNMAYHAQFAKNNFGADASGRVFFRAANGNVFVFQTTGFPGSPAKSG
jgi:hypothetical protein